MKTQAISNLNFVNEMEVSFDEETLELKFSTGFKTKVEFTKEINGIKIYSYFGYNNSLNFLHTRKVGNLMYCQTVQNGLTPGGSTFTFNL